MLYTIVNDQPFQVLSDSFTISPSESGYELYLSADGVNYSQFITVPSGVTKQMVDMNNGNFYRLMGNTSIVTVNWSRDCCGGQGGGGGVAGVSSLNGQTGALTTKTINGNDILGSGDITIEGGAAQYDLDAMTQAERAEFVAMCENLTDEERKLLFVYRDGVICTFDHTEGSGDSFKIGFFDTRNDGWSYTTTKYRHFFVKADGSFDEMGYGIFPEIITYDTNYSDTTHALSSSDSLSPLLPIMNLNAGNEGKVAINLRLIVQSYPAKIVLSSKAWSELTEHLVGKIGAEWHYNGNVITAVWNVVEHNATIESWTEVPEGGDGIYYIDGDNINNYSGVVDEIYHKLSSGETVYATVNKDYTKFPVAKAEIYEYQEGQPGDSDYLRQEGFQIIAARFGSDGYAIRSGIINVFRYEGRDGNGYSCGQGWDYAMPEASATVQYLTEDTWPGAYWEIGTGEVNTWGASIRRPDNTEIFETYNRTNKCVVMGEGNIGNFNSQEGNLTITDENEHIMLDGQGNRYVFRMDFSNGRLYFYHSPEQVGNFVYEGAQGAQHTTGETSGTVHIELAKVLSGDSWVQKDEMLFPKTYFIDNMTTEERVALYNLIRYSGPKVSPISKFCRFFSQITDKDGFMGMCEVYFCRFDTNLSFSGNAMSRNSDALIKVSFNLTSDGNIDGKTVTEYSLSEKVVSLSQSDYDALVQAGTVDANTLYVII